MSSSIILYLTRHGRTEWNHAGRFQGQSDIPLDDVGRAQAAALARVLAGKVEVAVASDLSRASETARIICEELQIPLIGVDPELRERGFGIFEGLTRAECMERHPVEWAAREGNRNFEVRGGEPPPLVIERMQRALERTVQQLRGRYQRALVVSHGSSLRMFLESLTGEPHPPIGNLEFREVQHDGERFSRV
ncbi:MAG: histidine phosphatase family protein [Polyangiales bacterium]